MHALVEPGRHRQRDLLHLQLDGVLAGLARRGREHAVDVALGDGDLRREPPPDHLAPGKLRPEPLAHGRGRRCRALLRFCTNCSCVILLRSAMPFMMRLTSSSVISMPQPLGLLQLQPLVDQLFLRFLLELRNAARHARSRPLDLLDHVELQTLLANSSEDGAALLARLAVASSRISRLQDGAQLLRWSFGHLRPARLGSGLERPSAILALRARNARPLLDLVGGDRLVVDEHDDGLLALGGRRGLLLGLGGAGCGGLPGRGCFWAASGAGSNSSCRRMREQERRRRRRCEIAGCKLIHGGRAGFEGANSTQPILPPSHPSAILVIHRTTVARAWQRHWCGVSEMPTPFAAGFHLGISEAKPH